METVYGLGVLLFFIGVAAYVWLTIAGLRTANENLRRRAAAAEQELAEIVSALSEPERKQVERERNRSRPMPNPPRGLWPTLERLRQLAEYRGDPYGFAVGWEVTRSNPDIVGLSLANDSEYRSGNIAITGEPGHGKGTLGQIILLQLTHNTTTSQARIQIIDPKVSDGALWTGKAHLWRDVVLGDDLGSIRAIMDALREERGRRDRLRAQYRVREWEELPLEVRPPRLIVWITELSTVTKAIEKCDDWLEDELSKCRASGIVYILDLQNQSGKETAWRSQIGTFIAGFQSSAHHIRPNVGLSADEIAELGGVLPTELRKGQFTVRNKRDVLTVAAPYLSTQDIEAALQPLPKSPGGPVAVIVPASVAAERRSTPVEELPITAELWTKIAAVARDLELNTPRANRAEVYRIVFANGDPNAKPRGENYTRVKMVCDAEGLIMPRTAPAAAPEMVDTA